MRNQAISKAVIIVTIVVVVVAAIVHFSSNRSALVRDIPVKKYTNSTYGISFSYAETYNLTEKTITDNNDTGNMVTLIGTGVVIPKNGGAPPEITMGMYHNRIIKDVKMNPVEAWILRDATSSNFIFSRQRNPGESRIGDRLAYLYTWKGQHQGTSLVTEYRGNIIIFTVTYDGDTTADIQRREDFTRLVDSVRFVGDTSTSTPVRK